MRRLDTITGHADRIRIGTWRGDPTIALLSPTPGSPPSTSTLDRALDTVRSRGLRTALTPALSAPEVPVFLDRGFVVHERLHLLGHDLSTLPIPGAPGLRLRRARPRDLDQVLGLDRLAFDDFWRFDLDALFDARSATPRSRFRVAVFDDRVIGYHITGAAGPLGYLQRLAIHPDVQGRGFGTALVGDCLHWCHRRRCTTVLVNTQESNTRALSLYEHLGFTHEPTGLAVLSISLDGSDA